MPSAAVARHFYAHYLLAMDRAKEAAAETRRALDFDPSNSFLVACGCWHHIATGEYDEAEKQALRALSMGAPDQLARVVLGWSHQLRGRQEQALPEFQKAVVGWKNAVFPTAALAHAYAVAGQAAAAREVLDKLLARSKTDYVSPYEIAVIHAGLGDSDRAFEWLCSGGKGVRIHAAAAAVLQELPRMSPGQFVGRGLPGPAAHDLGRLTRRILEWSLEKPLRSYPALRQIWGKEGNP